MTLLNKNKMDSLQCLRGFAAVSVVFYHFSFSLPLWSDKSTSYAAEILSKGYLGVDIFFVISGFILAWVGVLSRAEPANPGSFAIKRFFRIAPSYWVSMLFIAYLLSKSDPSGVDFLKMMFFIPLGNLQAPYYSLLMNDVGWTLCYEIAFYLIFCISLFFGRFALAAAVSIILFFVFILPIFFGILPSFDSNRDTQFSLVYLRLITNPMMLEFIPGIAAAWGFYKFKDKIPTLFAWLIFALGVTLLIYGYLNVDKAKGFSFLGAALPAGLVILGATIIEYRGMINFPKFLVWLGDVSFALYLTHWALRWGIFEKYFPSPVTVIGIYGGIFVKMSIALGLSFFWKKYIEDPTSLWANKLENIFFKIKNNIRIPQRLVPTKSGYTTCSRSVRR